MKQTLTSYDRGGIDKNDHETSSQYSHFHVSRHSKFLNYFQLNSFGEIMYLIIKKNQSGFMGDEWSLVTNHDQRHVKNVSTMRKSVLNIIQCKTQRMHLVLHPYFILTPIKSS